jgi:hypothetical protein
MPYPRKELESGYRVQSETAILSILRGRGTERLDPCAIKAELLGTRIAGDGLSGWAHGNSSSCALKIYGCCRESIDKYSEVVSSWARKLSRRLRVEVAEEKFSGPSMSEELLWVTVTCTCERCRDE